MHRCCSGSQGHVMGPCTCGMFHSQTNSFSMLFSMPNHKPPYDDHSNMYDYSFSPPSSSVDCTLSLGTPSTRFTQDEEKRTRHLQRRSVSNFCWDLLQSQSQPTPPINTASTNDPLLARRCANCDTTSTPLWRNGPRGPKSLCNACGIRFKKEERRASAAAAAPTAASGVVMESAQMYNSSWYAHSQSQKMQCFSPAMANEFRFVDDGDRDSDNGIPFLSWRLNVTEGMGLVHDLTLKK
ncbi:GATA transcription factor 19-like [Abrus precatorius]|uniref:GATA transcription factor 19-like n=1 Tax=Abrus precatorius TaxID=3816 RepID=A0A8B8M4N1_ABRPR|nr:GATA transcription factor 19-like [Abrus precatorius]